MKIIQSFWSKPLKEKLASANEKKMGGWRHQKYFYISLALSCLTFRNHYKEVELITDNYGAKLLVDTLKLPYTSISVSLDNLDNYPSQLWAVGKLHAYSVQKDPFIHVDNDVYIWDRFHEIFTNHPLLAQHLDLEQPHYEFAMDHIIQNQFSIPDILTKDYQKIQRFEVANAGIIGGSDVDFFQEFSRLAFNFINQNFNRISARIIGSSFALLYEQYLFSALARQKGIEVSYLYEEKDFSQLTISNFINRFKHKKYVHLLSDTKTYFENCRELEHQLALDFPEYYDLINSLFYSNSK
jgi:hypothetical protein